MQINLPGEHNILNCLAALAVSRELSVPIKDIQKSLKSFPGIKRRYEIIGEFKIENKKFTWIDDYGHHPTEIKEVLRSVKKVWQDKNITMIFQPHRYSRTEEHFNYFIDVLKGVDNLILMDIYSANEKRIENISSSVMADQIKKYNNNVSLINDHQEIEKFIQKNIVNDSILLTMGAGDISKFINSYKKILI